MDKEKELLYLEKEDELSHYGTPKHSGRYPWGSGENPYQNSGDFLSRYEELKKQGLKEKEIAEAYGIKTPQLRAQLSVANSERRANLIATARSLEADGLNRVQIAAKMGLKGESSVRSLLDADSESRMKIAEKTANNLKLIVDDKGMIDIGVGVERQLGISKEKLNQAVEILKFEGYEVWGGRVPQATNKGKLTTLRVLCVPGTPHRDIFNYTNIKNIDEYISYDNGDTLLMDANGNPTSFLYPKSLDSNRLQIRYAEDGGDTKDGVIELRRGVKDISLGNSNYSQVRILVDDTHYIKGMAIYSDNLPDGCDIMFNTNKSNSVPKIEVLKKIKNDPDNPFGSTIKEIGGQSFYKDENGVPQLSLINKRADEGDWGSWSKELSSQFLAKQPMKLINKQLNLAISDKQDEYDEIISLTNPTVKKTLLTAFSDDCDAAAIHLKAAALPGQTYKVILPINSLKDNEVYNPLLDDGTQMALVRYPHGGTFEIPILTNNTRNREGISVMSSNPTDAIGINANVAKILSGADFDGDTVMVIPLNGKIKIASQKASEDEKLKQLADFDNKLRYGPDPGSEGVRIIKGKEHYFRGGKEYTPMKETSIQLQMGTISNLITDMTLKGANNDEIAKAVKHSMVIIDAHKHNLDYRASEKDNDVRLLHKKYQTQVDEHGRIHLGASTLISKAKSETTIPERKEGAFFAKDTGNKLTLIDADNKIFFDEKTNKVYTENEKRTLYADPNTGVKLYHDTNREFTRALYKNEKGKLMKSTVRVKDGKLYYKDEDGNYVWVTNERLVTELATMKSTNMADTTDARTLSSGLPQEEAYATYANKLKSLANQARKEVFVIKDIPYSASARLTYLDEVESLDFKLNKALLNAPKERQAQIIATSAIKAKKLVEPSMTSEQIKKLEQQELSRARGRVGAKRSEVVISQKEWAAIQAGAISKTKLEQIIANANLDTLRQLAMPRTTTTLSENKIRRLKNMANAGYTTAEIAKSLNISTSTVSDYLKGGE
jgi:DNA-binding NarL/FixJ family response regulator